MPIYYSEKSSEDWKTYYCHNLILPDCFVKQKQKHLTGILVFPYISLPDYRNSKNWQMYTEENTQEVIYNVSKGTSKTTLAASATMHFILL